jgi:small subunit ribosomal protein S2
MRQLLEAGVHFGHQTHRWNPKMAPYIFGARSNIHILDLSQTVPLLHQALVQVRETAAKGGRVLFVGTKRAASEPVKNAAKRSAQYYVNHRWLGGMLTNWQTVSKSIQRLRDLEAQMESGDDTGFTKKEMLKMQREYEKLERELGGIKDMGGKPDLMFVVDTLKEGIAIKEARRLGIPVIAILDSNCDPENADLPIPGNDDSTRAIQLYCELIADAVLDGLTEAQMSAGVDLGASEDIEEMALNVDEPVLGEPTPAAAAPVVVPTADPATVAPVVEAPAAEAPAAEAKSEDKPDDVSLIDGVGPTYAKKLNGGGYSTFASIAALSDEEAAKVDEELALGGKLSGGDWREQAKDLAAGGTPRAKVDQAKAEG